MLKYGIYCECLPLRKVCIVFGLVEAIARIPHIAVAFCVDGEIIDIIEVIIASLLSGLLIYGAINKHVGSLWLWIFVQIVHTMLSAITLLYYMTAWATDAESINIAEDLQDISPEVLIGLGCIYIAVYIFLIVIVHRFVGQLRHNETLKREQRENESNELA